MKNIFNCILFCVVITLYGCNNKEIGYLEVENAKYSLNEIVIYNASSLQKEIDRLDTQLSSFDDLLKEKAKRDKAFEDAEKELNKLANIRDDIQWEWWEYEDNTPNPDPDIIADFESRFEVANQAYIDYKKGFYNPTIRACEEIDEQIEQVKKDMGIDIKEIESKVTFYKKQIEKNIPWSSTAIEGVLGTKPLIYTLEGVTSDNGQAEVFLKYLSVMGGGRVLVDPKIDAEPGEYIISLKVENEGQVRELRDIIKFIVK